MQKTRPRRVSSKVLPTDYVNTETGELLSSECKDKISITLKENTNQFIINSDEFVTFDSEAMRYLSANIMSADLNRIFDMANMLKTDCSILTQNNNHPHDTDTLSATLNLSLNKFYEFVRRLVKRNILCYATCAPSGYVQKIYMLNPYIARKRTTFSCEMSKFFRDITKDGVLKD